VVGKREGGWEGEESGGNAGERSRREEKASHAMLVGKQCNKVILPNLSLSGVRGGGAKILKFINYS